MNKSYPIPGPWKGRLSIIPRPQGGDWLDAEVRDWKEAGIDAVVSLLTPSEEWELGLQREPEVSQARGFASFHFPFQTGRHPALPRSCAV
jgi:hypothetical protein